MSSNMQVVQAASGRKRLVRLRRSNTAGVGYTRRRSGRGFSYRDADGRTVTDPELRARFAALVIPPAWTDVWIAPYPNGHIQATGVDAAGRRQYQYHPDWHTRQDRVKFARALELAQSLPSARGYVTRSLRRTPSSADESRDRALAAAFRILDQGALRIGSERYAEENGSHGLSTLLRSHVRVTGDTVVFEFPAKSGQSWSSILVDADVAGYVRDQDRLLGSVDPDYVDDPERVLLTWIDDDTVRTVSASDVNQFIKDRTGGDFSAKDFRTLRGTVAAAVSLARTGAETAARARSRALTTAMNAAADVLGNTPTIARSSYVDPRVVDAYNMGRTIDPARAASAESEVRRLLLD
ncbi:DNA topoisomerase IB [Cryobacterium arcticum]|nr:DNA topoisomerase IB [Cryobacterium arcticum]